MGSKQENLQFFSCAL